MKITILTLAVIFLTTAVFAQHNLKVEIETGNIDKGTVLQFGIAKAKVQEKILLSKVIVGKNYSLIVRVGGAENYFIKVGDIHKDFYLQPGSVKISIVDPKLGKIIIKDNIANLQYEEYLIGIRNNTNFTKVRNTWAAKDEYLSSNKLIDSTLINWYDDRIDSLTKVSQQVEKEYLLNWFKLNPNSWINTKVLFQTINRLPDTLIISLFAKIPEEQKKNSWAMILKYWINNIFVGATFKFYNFHDQKSNLTLPKIGNSKYTLVNFWASWCAPCRKENPKLKSIYTAFYNKGFEIIGISLDEKKEDWLKAIKQDDLNWDQFIALPNGLKSNYDTYFIPELPYNFLIDEKGKILGKNMSLKELNVFLIGKMSKDE